MRSIKNTFRETLVADSGYNTSYLVCAVYPEKTLTFYNIVYTAKLGVVVPLRAKFR